MFKQRTWGIVKMFIVSCLIACGLLYCIAYFVAPYFLNQKDAALLITRSVEKSTGLIVLIDNHRLNLSPKFDIKLNAANVSVFYPNKKQFLNIDDAELELSLFALLKKEIYVKNVRAKNLQVSTKLLKNGKTTIQTYFDEHSDKSVDLDYRLSSSLPSVNIANYLVKIKDEKSQLRLKIKGEKFVATQSPDIRYMTFNTKGNVFVSDERRVNYNAKLDIPKDLISFNENVSPISLDGFLKQRYTADVNANLKLYSKDSKFDFANGTVDIDNFIFYLAGAPLPPSYFHVKTNKGHALVDSKFYTDKKEVTRINANVKLKRPYSADVNFICPNADISNLLSLTSAFMNLLNIKNNLADFKADGNLMADFSVFWTENLLKSKGSLKISNGSFVHKSVPLKITSANAFVDFSNDKLDIKKSAAFVNNQPIKISGYVLSNSTGKINVKADNLDLNNLLKAFPFVKINNDIMLKTGLLSFDANIDGKLSNVSPVVNASVTNLSGDIKSVKSNFSVSKIQVITKVIKNKPSGNITLNGLKLCSNRITKTVSLVSDKLNVAFDDKNLKLLQSKISTGNANLTVSGDVKNYSQMPNVNIDLRGTVDTNFLKSLAPKDLKLYNKGYLPVRIHVSSQSQNNNNIDIDLKALANSSNYITPIVVKSFSGKNTLTHLQAVLNESEINIKDLSLYYANSINSLVNDVNVSGLKKILGLKGKLKNYSSDNLCFDNLRILVPEPIIIELPDFINSSAKVAADINLNGNIKSNLSINGTMQLDNVVVPEYMLSVGSAALSLKNRTLNGKFNNIKVDNTLLSAEMLADIPKDIKLFNKINSLNIIAEYIDLEKMLELVHKMFQAKYAPGAELPIDVTNGKINIKTVKMDVITAQNVSADFNQTKNTIHLNNLVANSYGGKVVGKAEYNLPYSSFKAVLQGRGLNADAATTALMPKEQRLTGTLNFDADISAYGNTFEQQMKSLSGQANLFVKNGYFAQLGRFEHFLYAQNLLSQKLIYASLNSAKQAIKPQDTGRFTELKGSAKFSHGYVHLNPVTTSGPQMSMHITGRINMLNNEADLKVLGKVSSEVSSSLGLLGKMTIKDFVDEHTKYGQALSDLFNFCNSELPEVDITKIPVLSPDMKYQTKNFQVLLNGNMSSVKAVKSFTWVNPLGTKKKAASAVSATTSVTSSNSVGSDKNSSSDYNVDSEKPVINQSPDFLDNIPDNFN